MDGSIDGISYYFTQPDIQVLLYHEVRFHYELLLSDEHSIAGNDCLATLHT